MRSLLTAFLLLVSLHAFAAEPLIINDSVTASVQATPDSMTSSVSITYRGPTYIKVSLQMEKLAALVKNNKICTYNSYSVSPRYTYDKGKIVDRDYQGSLRTSCSFKTPGAYENVINDLLKVTSGEGFTQSMAPVVWTVSDESRTAVTADLKKTLVKKAMGAADAYGKYTGMECRLAKLNFGSSPSPYLSSVSSRALSEAKIRVTVPDRKDVPINLNADITVNCR